MGETASKESLMQLANQFGLLGIVSVMLGALTIMVALAGLYAFFDVRRGAKAVAAKEAKLVAEAIAEAHAVAYLQEEIPALLAAYSELAQGSVSTDQADDIAGAQEDGDHG